MILFDIHFILLQKVSVTDSKEHLQYLPVQIGNVSLYGDSDLFIMESLSGFRVEYNFRYQICTLEVSGKCLKNIYNIGCEQMPDFVRMKYCQVNMYNVCFC